MMRGRWTPLFLSLSLHFHSLYALPLNFQARQVSLDAVGVDSCLTDPLNADTWTKLDIDTFLKDWTAANVTASASNNVQTLASTFEAPNFFCGLDNFCNAGQPCVPVDLPAWYALVAIQNWNSYMNSVNTAITFASSIVSQTLPGMVNDFLPDPRDDVTPLNNILTMFTSVVSLVPFTGPVSTAASAFTGTTNFIVRQMKPPQAPDRFLQWSDISASLADVVKDYQAAVSTFIDSTIDAPVDSATGINAQLTGGQFLGVSQNFTQTDLQNGMIESIKMHALGLIFQNRKIFLSRSAGADCTDPNGFGFTDKVQFCTEDGAQVLLLIGTGNGNSKAAQDEAELLISKYGLTVDDYIKGPLKCFDDNGGKQLTNPFLDSALPLDPKTPCLFNLLVCDQTVGGGANKGTIDFCREDKGLDV